MEESKSCLELEEHSSTIIDPRGDVILDVGPLGAKQSFQVSSSVLSLGSPVFAAMLNSTFLEGAVPTDGTIRTISLQEDNPQAVTTLLNILHLQSQHVLVWSFTQLDQLAILCDKYDCARALKPWTTLWLQSWSGSVSGEDSFWKTLYISYALDDSVAFYSASLGILQVYTDDETDCAPGSTPGLAILPDDVIDGLQAQRRAIVEGIHQQLNNVITGCMEDARSRIMIRAESCFSTAKTGSFFLELSRIGLWPISETSRKCSIEQLLIRLSGFREYRVEKLDAYSSFSRSCCCITCKVNFRGEILKFVTEQETLLKGLCLTCARAGRPSVATGNCQSVACCYGTGGDNKCSPAAEGAIIG